MICLVILVYECGKFGNCPHKMAMFCYLNRNSDDEPMDLGVPYFKTTPYID